MIAAKNKYKYYKNLFVPLVTKRIKVDLYN